MCWLMSPWMHQLMKVAPVGGGMRADCPPTDKVHVHAPPRRCQHPVPVVAFCHFRGFIFWRVSSCCLCGLPSITAGLIETALSFQVESETVAFTSSSASEKVGQVRARRGRPLTSDLTPPPTRWSVFAPTRLCRPVVLFLRRAITTLSGPVCSVCSHLSVLFISIYISV